MTQGFNHYLEVFLHGVIMRELKSYPLPAAGNNSPLAFASGLCGDGVGEGEGEDEKDRDLSRKDRRMEDNFLQKQKFLNSIEYF